ncbi:MAG: UvrD-helicase domain-containing protein, partial [Psychroserpens sp.]|nr:UvrD-helicase domain-containing protein [Psychroserpens sp.]
NYASFDISTIDKFNHRLIRTFAHDLKLPVNFEVELDIETILAKAVDHLIDQAGSENALTKVLVDFAIEKTDDDRSWDITHDFNQIARLIVQENDLPFIQELSNKSLEDFKLLKQSINQQQNAVTKAITNLANDTLELIKTNGLNFEDFTRKTLPNHFLKASNLEFKGLYNNKLEDHLSEGTSIYNKSLDPAIAERIDTLIPRFFENFKLIKQLVFTSIFLKNALRNITPLSVLGAIGKSLNTIKEEEDLLLISEFNSIIHSEIQQQPVPFIYERMGEKFKHYFIDEFQDTSTLQWQNLIPLIGNAISGETSSGDVGSLMLVGDPKQAIYRWRGGRAEQFIDLYSRARNPFPVVVEKADLPTNYRSHKTIVEFNNAFFNHIADLSFSSPQHREIYKLAQQNNSIEKEGFIELAFLNIEDQTKNELHAQATLDRINAAISQGFSYADICIIVRKTKEGRTIASYLSEAEIPIISSETLLLQNAPEIQFLVQLIGLNLHPNNDELKIQILTYLAEHKIHITDSHEFFSRHIVLKPDDMFKALDDYGYRFDFSEFGQLPMYEAIESAIRAFKFNTISNAYLQFFMDEIFDYAQKYDASFSGFLDYWDRKKNTLSIVSPKGKNAVTIMTIHKSKGLEFPVVIFPFANQDIYADINPKVWFPVNADQFGGFSHLYVNMTKDLESFNDNGALLYQNYRSQLELDSINLLYVVLTRAIEQLYIISEYDLDKSNTEKHALYSGLFINYLKTIGDWNDDQMSYTFGNAKSLAKKETKINTSFTLEHDRYISIRKEDHNLNILSNRGFLWDSSQEAAIERGELIHEIMSLIKTPNDLDFALNQFINTGTISVEQASDLEKSIKSLMHHSVLHPFYETADRILNEKDILTKSGNTLRPDRVVINSKQEACIIDYKTGKIDPKHQQQLYEYQDALEAMGIRITKKILIYINHEIVIKEF